MAKFKINYIKQVPLNNGKVKKSATLVDEQGVETKFVTIWPDFLNFVGLGENQVIEGELKIVQNGQYTNATLYPPSTAQNRSNGAVGGSKGGFIALAQENQAQLIQTAQNNKEEGIKTSSTIRMAVDLAIAEKAGGNPEPFPQLIKGWRSWLIANWNLPTSPVDMDSAPF